MNAAVHAPETVLLGATVEDDGLVLEEEALEVVLDALVLDALVLEETLVLVGLGVVIALEDAFVLLGATPG